MFLSKTHIKSVHFSHGTSEHRTSTSEHRNSTSEHRTSTKQHQRTLFPVVDLISLQVFPTISASFSVILLQFVIGLHLLRFPWEFLLKACFCVSVESFLTLRLIHFHFRSLICTATGFSCARLHSSSFDVKFLQQLLQILRRHLFVFTAPFATFHVLQP